MWFVALAACHWTPAQTGPDGMVGTLRDAAGAPVAGQSVETLEAEVRTDATGRFAVTYKAPNTEVHFVRGLVFFQRRWLPSDPAVVELALPVTRELALACGELACDVTLTWALGEGYEARVAGRCAPQAELPLGTVPAGAPVASCRTGLGAAEAPLTLEDHGDRLVAVPPPTPIVVRIPGAPVGSCAATIDGIPAAPAPDGSFTAEGRGHVLAAAVCDGRPARPLLADLGAGDILLDWSPEGPWLRVPGAVGELQIQCRGTTGSWTATWIAAADGRFLLPPLEAGQCELVLAVPELRGTAWAAEGNAEGQGAVTLREVAPGAFKGWLALANPLTAGEIPVRR
jgi:hypothetical protein